jgi:hypothetical protein
MSASVSSAAAADPFPATTAAEIQAAVASVMATRADSEDMARASRQLANHAASIPASVTALKLTGEMLESEPMQYVVVATLSDGTTYPMNVEEISVERDL